MNNQYEMIRHTWNKIQKDHETLSALGYNSLYNLSVSEMMFIFEAIGASVQKNMSFGTKEDFESRFEKKSLKSSYIDFVQVSPSIDELAVGSFREVRRIIETVVPLISKNALTYYAVSKCPNVELKEKILESKLNIGFAYNEYMHDQSIGHHKWTTKASLSNDHTFWLVSGEKSYINDGDYSHYLVFCRTGKFTEQQIFSGKIEGDGIVALLLSKDQVTIEKTEPDYFGVSYQRIKFEDVEVLRDQGEILPAQQDICEFLNVKSCGQCASSAVILGFLKQLLKNTYAHLINHNIALSYNELIQYKLFQATSKIYSIESMLYLTAAMFDSFEKDSNLQGESIALKTLATEYAYDVINSLRSIFGARYPISSSSVDLVNFFDSFLDTSANNRILLGQNAVEQYKFLNPDYENEFSQYLVSSIYALTKYLRYRKANRRVTFTSRQINKYIHHNMHPACDWLEHMLNQLEYTTNFLINTHHKVNADHFTTERLTVFNLEYRQTAQRLESISEHWDGHLYDDIVPLTGQPFIMLRTA